MARPKCASARTQYRQVRARLADLVAQQAKLQRSRPRTPGKKAAKTRALNRLAGQIPAAKGLVTKARRAVAALTKLTTASSAASYQKRSEAAKRGWETRRARRAAARHDGAKFMPMLTRDGVVWINPLGDDRSILGGFWNDAALAIDNLNPFALMGYDGLSLFDTETNQRLPFITDMDTVLAYHEHYDFGPSIYRTRGEVPRYAR